MKDIVPYISPLVESQFPAFYREEGPMFIALVKSYYEWLEQSNNAIYQARKLLEYRDIDQTIDDFIVYFKEETLKNVQFETASNKRLFVKNALDFYRSKGTERSIDLFFKLVYAQPAKVYHPGDDLFKLSDNKWKIPEYLEVNATKYNASYEGKQVTGLISGATAFVENYAIKKKINNQFDTEGNVVRISKEIHVFYITNVRGVFQYGETVVYSGITEPEKAPKLIGSLTELQVIAGASDYVIGDVVELISNTGFNGKALVTSVANVTGQVDFTLIDGGWGYSTSPKIIISDKSLLVNNVLASTGSTTTPFKLFSTLIQPKAYVEFGSLSGTGFQSNDYIYTYTSGDVTSVSRIVTVSTNTSSGTGNLYVSVLSGSIPGVGNTFYNEGNSVYASITLRDDTTATANIMGCSSNNDLLITDIENGVLPIVGEEVYQSNTTHGEWVNAIVNSVTVNAGLTIVSVVNSVGTFLSSQRVKGRSSSSNTYLSSYSTFIGIYDSSETSVISVEVTNIGNGYSNGELVKFTSDSGFGAIGMVQTYGNSSVEKINILNGGSNYITAPSVKIVNTAIAKYFNANTDVSETLDFIYIPNNGFVNAQAIRYGVRETDTALNISIEGENTVLINNRVYYAKIANSLGIQLSIAPSGNAISLTKGLTQNGHSFTEVVSSGTNFAGAANLGSPFDFDNDLYVYAVTSNAVSFNASSDITSNFITLNKKLLTNGSFVTIDKQPFANGQAIVYTVAQGNTKVDLLANNTVYYVKEANNTGIKLSYANGTTIPIVSKLSENGHSFAAYTSAILDTDSEGSLAELRVASLDDEETVELNTDFIGGYNIYGVPYLKIKINSDKTSSLSIGSDAYGFPANPYGNLTSGTIRSMLSKELFTIGTISVLGTVNPGDDYTFDPFVTIIEPVVAGHRRYDQIMTIDGSTNRFSPNENIFTLNRKAFDGSSGNVSSSFIFMNDHPYSNSQPLLYFSDTGYSVVGGLANSTVYYVKSANNSGFSLATSVNGSTIVLTPTASYSKQYVQGNNYEKYGSISQIIDTTTMKVKRLTMFNEINPSSEVYLEGETSKYVVRVVDSIDDKTYSGLNSIVNANTVVANGVVKTLKVIDSGFAYDNKDVMSFQRQDDTEATVGLVKGSNIRQGLGSGYYEGTKGFLSQDKYLHDNDFYQDYSYQIISRIPFDRYSKMLKKVLHVAGTKFFPGVEIESKGDTTLKVTSSTIVVE